MSEVSNFVPDDLPDGYSVVVVTESVTVHVERTYYLSPDEQYEHHCKEHGLDGYMKSFGSVPFPSTALHSTRFLISEPTFSDPESKGKGLG